MGRGALGAEERGVVRVKGAIGRADNILPNWCTSEALSITRGGTVIGQSARVGK